MSSVKGWMLGAVAACTYGMNPLFALPLYADGLRPESVLLWRYAVATLTIGLMLIARRGPRIGVAPRHLPALVLLGILMAVSSQTLFAAYNYMAAGVASTLLFVYPIMTAVLMALFFKERAGVITFMAIAVALVGIALLYKGDGNATLSLVGTLLVMASALSYAIYLVFVDHLGLASVPPLKVTFYVVLTGLAWFLIFVSTSAQGIVTPSAWWLWGCAVALGVLPTAVSLLCTTAAIPIIGSTATAILGALEPVTAVIIGTMVFDEPLTGRLCIGIVLIILAVVMVIASGHKMVSPMHRLRHLWPRTHHWGRHL